MIKYDSKQLTICIPTLNRYEKLKDTLGVLLTSKIANIEILVSDNGSTDETWSYLSALKDERLTVSRNSENIGFTGNILKLLELSHTNFVLFMSDEDYVCIEGLKNILSSDSFNADTGIVYPSVMHEKKKSYYYKYSDSIFSKSKAINRFVLSHSYMSGMIFNKNFISIEKFKNATLNEDVVLYPHEIIAYMILSEGGKLISKSIPIAYQGEAEESEAITKYKYYEYKERLKLFQQYNRVIHKLNFDKKYSNIFFRKMSIVAACVLVDEVLNKGNSKKDYLKEVYSLKCSVLFDFQFLFYAFAFFVKRKLKPINKSA